MNWRWDEKRHQYVSDSGDVLGGKELQAIRDGLAEGFSEQAADLVAQQQAGSITADQFAARFSAFVDEATRAQFLLGRGGVNAAASDDFATMAKIISDQLGFADGFAKALANGEISAAEATARAELYAGSAVSAFEQGMAASHDGLELPFYPADGDTPCLGGCRCSWEIEDDGEQYTATWITEGDGNVCDGCLERGAQYGPGSPIVQMKAGAG